MSELKDYNIMDIEAMDDERLEKSESGKIQVTRVYIKSAADKVIANLEDELRAANEQIENLINSASSIMLFQDRVNDNKCDELRHQKYKRCLNKAEWCEERSARYDLLQERTGFDWSREIGFYFKWQQRWLELADKFKEAK